MKAIVFSSKRKKKSSSFLIFVFFIIHNVTIQSPVEPTLTLKLGITILFGSLFSLVIVYNICVWYGMVSIQMDIIWPLSKIRYKGYKEKLEIHTYIYM